MCPRKTQRKQNQNKVNEAKTIENIKYKPFISHLVVLFVFHGAYH